MAVSSCGGDSAPVETSQNAPTRPTAPGDSSSACRSALARGHNLEAAGQPTPESFVESVQACSSLAEWTAMVKASGVDLQGREPNFVESVCAAADPATQARPICKEATLVLQQRAAASQP